MTVRYLILVLLLLGARVQAAPTGADLLRACGESRGGDLSGIEGAMCEYYVTPCACEIGAEPAQPDFCPPQSVSTLSLAETVVAGLREAPELQRIEARVAAARVLAKKYPCNE